jgi:hypothetical protein
MSDWRSHFSSGYLAEMDEASEIVDAYREMSEGMPQDHIKIKQLSLNSAEVVINGVDMARIVSAYHVHADMQDGPQVVIQFAATVLPEFDGPADVQVTQELHEALIHLGWTAPRAPERVENEITTLNDPHRTYLAADGTVRTVPWPAVEDPLSGTWHS